MVLHTESISEKQVGKIYDFNVPSSYTNAEGIWTLSGSTARSITVTTGENVVEVSYVKPIIQSQVIVKYVSDDAQPILLNTAFEGNKMVGSTYSHTAPSTYTYEGEWELVGSAGKNITVQNKTNEIVYVYKRVLSTDQVAIQFADTAGMAIYPLNVLTTTNARI